MGRVGGPPVHGAGGPFAYVQPQDAGGAEGPQADIDAVLESPRERSLIHPLVIML